MWEKLTTFMTKKWKWIVAPSLVIGLFFYSVLAGFAGMCIYHQITRFVNEPAKVGGEQIKKEPTEKEEPLPEYKPPPPQETPEQPPQPASATYTEAELQQIVGEAWEYVWGWPPSAENFEWAKYKIINEGWSRFELQDYLMSTPEFKQAYPGRPTNMSAEQYNYYYLQMNAVWLQSRGRKITKEEFARILRGETIPPD